MNQKIALVFAALVAIAASGLVTKVSLLFLQKLVKNIIKMSGSMFKCSKFVEYLFMALTIR